MKHRIFCVVLSLLLLLPLTSTARAEFSADASAAAVMEVESGVLLYQQAVDETIYPASLTKIMTALVAVDHCPLDQLLTVNRAALQQLDPDSSTANLTVGEQLTLRELLYCMFLVSANDASCVVAEQVGGTVEQFVDMMNEKAAALGCTGTHFANPHGLHEDDHYTTVRDLVRIADAFRLNNTLMEISSTEHYSIPATDHNNAHNLYTIIYTNRQDIYPGYAYEGCRGIKTGTTSAAGKCLVVTCERDGLEVIAVVVGCPSAVPRGGEDWPGNIAAMHDLLDYIYGSFDMQTLRVTYADEIAVRQTLLNPEPEPLPEPEPELIPEPIPEEPMPEEPESAPLPWYAWLLIGIAALLIVYTAGYLLHNLTRPRRRRKKTS